MPVSESQTGESGTPYYRRPSATTVQSTMNQAPIPDEFPTEMMAPVQAPHPVFAPDPTLFPAPYPYPIQSVDQDIPMMQIPAPFYDAMMNQPQLPGPPHFGYPAVLPSEMMAPNWFPHPITFDPRPPPIPPVYPNPIRFRNQIVLNKRARQRPLAPGARRPWDNTMMNQPQFPRPPRFGYPTVLPSEVIAPNWVPHPITFDPRPAPIPPVYPNRVRFRNKFVPKKRVRQRKAAPGARRPSDDTSGKENQPQPSTSGLAGTGSRYARTHTESTGSDISMFNPTGASTPRRRSNSGEQEENGASATADTEKKPSS
ncbi:unnamed protein product [Acanthoscelides obtectus]|uniref:Uncharacterized protein n=1 Tax=Acanthoscelides obtectus TaxID=200917 RepID=A0A9P0LV71_ACAOB|nr:unnamed protein product [Acanthoscelides obtectus]CAK1628210.1 hypothetical protein AOBTE_LOCUS5074 [Acanthoscelides obtectus]